MEQTTTTVKTITFRAGKKERYNIKNYPGPGELEWHDLDGRRTETEPFDTELEAKKIRDQWIEEFSADAEVKEALKKKLLRRGESEDGLEIGFYTYASPETASCWPDEAYLFYILRSEQKISQEVT